MNTMKTQAYTEQLKCWPKQGRHILAQYDEESIVVYQAYRPAIGDLSDFVAEQREAAQQRRWDDLLTPEEHVHVPDDPQVAARLGLDSWTEVL